MEKWGVNCNSLLLPLDQQRAFRVHNLAHSLSETGVEEIVKQIISEDLIDRREQEIDILELFLRRSESFELNLEPSFLRTQTISLFIDCSYMEENVLVRDLAFLEEVSSLSNKVRPDVSDSVLDKKNALPRVFLYIGDND